MGAWLDFILMVV